MKNTNPKAKEICLKCWNTGYRVFKMGGYSYSRICKETPQPRLPLKVAK